MPGLLGHQTSSINVQTAVYEGPLDLLLDLIERAELDITTVSLALVTDQYLTYLRALEEAQAEEISAFLVIAAKLIQINELLDERVRPFLQSDGGDLYVVGLDDNVLQVHYQGACGSCPSSLSGTLAGITGLVRQIDPDLDVVAV